jgi:hypothetical protein
MQAEQPPFISFHQPLAFSHGVHDAEILKFRQKIRHHGISVGGNDSGDHKQQAPQENEKSCHDLHPQAATQPIKVGEQVSEPSLPPVEQVQMEGADSQPDGTADDQRQQGRYQRHGQHHRPHITGNRFQKADLTLIRIFQRTGQGIHTAAQQAAYKANRHRSAPMALQPFSAPGAKITC